MPMGFKNSHLVFQRLMDKALKDEIKKIFVVYVDDILIFGKTKEEHDKNLKIVLKKLIKAGLMDNREKCLFDQKEIIILG